MSDNKIMDKFYADIEAVLEKYNDDVTALDDYEVDREFIEEVIKSHYEKQNAKVLSLENIQVFDGPNVSSISISLSVRFDVKLLPDYNIEETKKQNIFIKIPIFEESTRLTSQKLCFKEIKVYEEFFRDLKEFHDHPIKGPFTPPVPTVIHLSKDQTPSLLVLTNVAEEGFNSPRERFLDSNELRSVLKSLAKFHADGIKFLHSKKDKAYSFLQVFTRSKIIFWWELKTMFRVMRREKRK